MHADAAEAAACTICYPDLKALIAEHNHLKQLAWSALRDVEQEISHGRTANWEYIERRLAEGQRR
jgi:hypothetical protein